jgi:hypothetical protein
MRDGECSEQPMLAPRTSANESGLWPTATCGGGGQTLPDGTTPTGKTPEGRKKTVCLERYVQQVECNVWPSPRANDAQKRGDFDAENPRNGLAGAVKKWPTPQARDYRSGEASRWTDKNRTRNLNDAVAFATPTATMHKGWSANHNRAETNDRLDYQIERGAEGVGRLNPQWVEWLMGWPLGWTDLKPLETDRFREWLLQHGGF